MIKKSLLTIDVLESCEPVWSDVRIIEQIKLAIAKDAALEPILAFFNEWPWLGSSKYMSKF